MKQAAFGDRVKQIGEWFQNWNSCEQTIALYSLLTKVSATQARFLFLVLENSLKNGHDSQELSRLEKQANSGAFLAALYSQPDGPALAQLLTHLPLLNPGNTEAREHYMKLMPKVLLGSSEDLEYLEQCRQLLSLALVHPAFPLDNREALSYWLARLDEKQKNITDRKHSMNGHLSAVPPPIPPRRIYQIPSKTEEGGGSSRMGGPSSLDSGRIYIKTSSGWAGQGDSLCNGFPVDPDMIEGGDDETPYNRERASTLGHHYGAPPTGDEYSSRQARCNTLPARPGHCDELPNQIEWKAGMKDVPSWLKSLRLHKYQHLFAELTYSEMLLMSEAFLKQKGVTKGACNKIILSVNKLVRRPGTLAELEQEMEKHGRLGHCIEELQQMLLTPIIPNASSAGREVDSSPKSKITLQLEPSEEKEEGSPGGGGEGEEELSSDSHCSSPSPSHSVGSDLEELLVKECSHDDLPGLITRTSGKAFHQLMKVEEDTDENTLTAFIKLTEAILSHEAFSDDHKKHFQDWQHHCQQALRMVSPRKSPKGKSWTPGCSQTFTPGMNLRVPKARNALRPAARIGSPAKGMALPNQPRSSSTMPHISPNQFPQSAPSPPPPVIRPKSTSSFPSQMNPNSKPFTPVSLLPSANGSYPSSLPPPIPPRSSEVNDKYMDDLCKRVTEQALEEDSSCDM